MTTIELLKERIEVPVEKTTDLDVMRNHLLIMQALVELLEKVDQPMEFSIPTQTPNVTQYIIGKPVTVIPESSLPTVVPQTPQSPSKGPRGLPPNQS